MGENFKGGEAEEIQVVVGKSESTKQNNGDNSGYLVNAESLGAMVKNSQFGFLAHYGGARGIANYLSSDYIDGLAITGVNLKEGQKRLHPKFLEERQKEYGSNALDPPTVPSYLWLIWQGMHDVTLIMLSISSIVSLVLGFVEGDNSWIEGAAILFTVVLVLNVQAGTDWSKARQFRAQQLELENSKSVRVIRDGKLQTIHPRDLVVGDLVRVEVGDILAADGVLAMGSEIKMDESALTGESKLVNKGSNPDSIPSEPSPFMLSGTNVMSGTGTMVVVAVGVHSLQGQILAAVGGSHDDEPSSGKKSRPRDEEEDIGDKLTLSEVEVLGEDHVDQLNDTGGSLVDKLNRLAIKIGKTGLAVAFVAFVVMVVRWSLKEFTGDNARAFDVTDDLSTLLQHFITAVTILVVAVPEGLPLAVTLALSISMRRMIKDNNQVKFMDSCETMGSATTICSDKTGTLTQNRMTVVRAALGTKTYQPDSQGNLGKVLIGDCDRTLVKLLSEAIALNTAPTSEVATLPNGTLQYRGNATECALLKLVLQLELDAKHIRKTPSLHFEGSGLAWGIKEFPFSSERKMMSWVVPHPTDRGRFRLFSKGAPDQIFANSTRVLDGSQAVPFNGERESHFRTQVAGFQNAAMRTLAIAYKDLDGPPAGPEGWSTLVEGSKGTVDQFEAERGVTLIGVFGIEDPLRPEVIDAIKVCNKAGVDVRMCTGDALATAVAIAAQCGILRTRDIEGKFVTGEPVVPKEDFAMTGAQFDERVHRLDTTKPKIKRRAFDLATGEEGELLAFPFQKDDKGRKVLNQAEFDRIWPKLRVLARCQPEDKLTLVRGMRKSQLFRNTTRCAELDRDFGIRIFPDYQVVAVTGDGTNDAPALKNADVGFAMGIVGTDIAKQACDIMLLDDNFASIVKAVMWGRNVYDSISKFIQFQLTVNVSAITVAVTGAFAFSASPLSPVQMLWVNLIMDSLASLALATEPPTMLLLERQPYGKRRPVMSRVMIFNMLGQSVYQIAVIMTIVFVPSLLPGDVVPYPPEFFGEVTPTGNETEPMRRSLSGAGETSVHWTIVFNAFVMMQLFNELNSRHLQTTERLRSSIAEWNVFTGITKNSVFVAVMVITFVLQVIIVQFAGPTFELEYGLSGPQWAFCMIVGAISLPWQFVINAALIAYEGVVGAEKEVVAKKKKAAPMNPSSSVRSLTSHRRRESLLRSMASATSNVEEFFDKRLSLVKQHKVKREARKSLTETQVTQAKV